MNNEDNKVSKSSCYLSVHIYILILMHIYVVGTSTSYPFNAALLFGTLKSQ